MAWFFTIVHLYRYPDWPIRKYRRGETAAEKIFMQPPFTITLQIPTTLALQKLQVVRVWVMEKMLHFCPAAPTVSIIVGTATPHQCLDLTKPPSTSVAFFLTFRFSNLVPNVAILKTFASITKIKTYICLKHFLYSFPHVFWMKHSLSITF